MPGTAMEAATAHENDSERQIVGAVAPVVMLGFDGSDDGAVPQLPLLPQLVFQYLILEYVGNPYA